MLPPTLSCARALRDGGIDAVAALNEVLKEAVVGLPAESQSELRREIGHAIAAVLDATVNPAVQAFPELTPDEATWISVAMARASLRASTPALPR